MRLTVTFALCLLAGPVLAESCDHWSASMEEDEGGPRMMASICSGTGDNQSTLLVQCGAEGELNLRFLPAPALDYPPNAGTGNFEAELKFALDKKTFPHKGQFEEMDGAMAIYIPIRSPLVQGMMTGKNVAITDTDGKMSATTFSLKNAGKALKKVIDACGN